MQRRKGQQRVVVALGVLLVTPRDTFPPALGGAQWHWLTLACSAIHTLMGSGIWEVAKPSGAPI